MTRNNFLNFEHTAKCSISRSMSSASFIINAPLSDEGNFLHGEPNLNASRAALTALSTSA